MLGCGTCAALSHAGIQQGRSSQDGRRKSTHARVRLRSAVTTPVRVRAAACLNASLDAETGRMLYLRGQVCSVEIREHTLSRFGGSSFGEHRN
jgi:hypothetical protein